MQYAVSALLPFSVSHNKKGRPTVVDPRVSARDSLGDDGL